MTTWNEKRQFKLRQFIDQWAAEQSSFNRSAEKIYALAAHVMLVLAVESFRCTDDEQWDELRELVDARLMEIRLGSKLTPQDALSELATALINFG